VKRCEVVDMKVLCDFVNSFWSNFLDNRKDVYEEMDGLGWWNEVYLPKYWDYE